jgi:periplasmic protein TonB
MYVCVRLLQINLHLSNLLRLPRLPSLEGMPLRCLLFSSDEALREPIWQVLGELGIEGEYCPSAVDAVERVTTQMFQIVVTDWEDQPEAAFLLKTVRDQKPAQRPLTLAIVGNDKRLPEALQAGANSVLLKPIRVEQVRDTMSTACELLRAKQAGAVAQPAPISGAPDLPVPPKAAAASAAANASSIRAPETAIGASENPFRPGEFLQSGTPAPSAQFDTESDIQKTIQKTMEQTAVSEMDALTELAPVASSVAAEPAAEPAPAPLTGWASLQERLTRAAPQAAPPSPKGDLLTYGEMSAFEPASAPIQNSEQPKAQKPQSTTPDEDALFAYMDGVSPEDAKPASKAPLGKSKIYFLTAVVAVFAVLIAVPQTRQRLQIFYTKGTGAGKSWLNPQPTPVPQVAAQHETFGNDTEYKLPAVGNIPDATTDPSQIRVVPVIDPTVKTKNTESTAATVDSAPGDSGQGQSNDGVQVVESPVKEQTSTTVGNAVANSEAGAPANIPPAVQVQPLPAPPQPAPQPVAPPPVASQTQAPAAPVPGQVSIPSSLRSQIASMTPEASGAKPPEAAMASIEPVNVPESAAWDLLAQKVDPIYPDAAKSAGQHGSVVLQVLIARDGTVQDAKFLQGSLLLARAAIDAVKQWHFKPYLLNGRPVSVQTTVTLDFKPPAQ